MSNVANNMINLVDSGKTVFTTADLALLWKIANRNTLRVTIHRAETKNYLTIIRKGIYRLATKEVDRLELAGKLKKFSYISFETALAQAGVIFQWHDSITAASDRRMTITNKYGRFVYRRLPKSVLINQIGIIKKNNYYIALAERALCDKIYKDGLIYFDDLSAINRELALKISRIYNKRLMNDVKKLLNK